MKELKPKKRRIYSMINKQEQEKVLRRSTYHKESTERLLDMKSQELGLSMNQTAELCLRKFLPEMKSSWS